MFLSSLLTTCIAFAADQYAVDDEMILSIAYVESGMKIDAINRNADQSEDIGLMQINSWWLSRFKDLGISKEDLFEPCNNIILGTWILRHSFDLYGRTWEAVGAYNAGTAEDEQTAERRRQYAGKVADVYQSKPWLHQ